MDEVGAAYAAAELTDTELEKEISFARVAMDPRDPATVTWLEALVAEADTRETA